MLAVSNLTNVSVTEIFFCRRLEDTVALCAKLVITQKQKNIDVRIFGAVNLGLLYSYLMSKMRIYFVGGDTFNKSQVNIDKSQALFHYHWLILA